MESLSPPGQPEVVATPIEPGGQDAGAPPGAGSNGTSHAAAAVASVVIPIAPPPVPVAAAEVPPPAAEVRPVAHVRSRFPLGPRSIWRSVPDASWNDWHWQQRERVTKLDQLEKVIRLTDEERHAVVATDAEFHMGITPYYAALMDPEDPTCPVRLQSVPTMGELTFTAADLEDPLAEERDMPVPGLTHRYPDRVLFYTTHNCPVYCRHCTRKRKVADPSSAAAKKQIEDSLAYIEHHTEIRDVVVSGGDPLSLSDDRLD
jgi:lysine 2,3-aminomutase